MSVTAIVPLKALAHSKQRLAPHLSAAERSALMRRLFTGVLHACRAAGAVDRVIAVVGDDTGLELARDGGAVGLREPGDGLNAAIAFATTHVPAGSGSLVVVADLPDVAAADLDAVVAAGTHAPCVVVAATDDGGTGALLRRPGAVIPPAFGQRSAAAHLTAAQRAGVRAVRLSLPGFARDIDAAVDLSDLRLPQPGRAAASDL